MKITSISRKLLTRVLSVYFILTISVTGIQIIAEYINTKSDINSELLTLEKTISGSLTRAVWELNTKQAIDISEGLIAIPLIKGITVTDEANQVITQLGEVLAAPSKTSQDSYNEHQSISSLSEGIFGYSFPLIFEFSGRSTTVGSVTLLSSNDVIFSRIEVGIYFLIGNAIVKTAFLVFLFSLAFSKLLTEPLQELTDQMKQLDIHDPEASKFHTMDNERNELSILEGAYNNLIDEVIAFKDRLAISQRETNLANEKLDEQNLLLEQEVARKTSTLSSTLLRMEVQQRELLTQQQQLEAENNRRRKTESTLMTTNKELKTSLMELNKAKDRLLEAEKMSSLGQLSAEVSHEINTPIGISITSTSYLADILNKLQQDINAQTISKRTINNFLGNAQHSVELLLNNLQRAAELIGSFKQVAVDQTNDKVRLINISKYLDEIIQSIHPKMKKTNHSIKIDCDPHIEIYTHPGAIAQIMINLIINSLTHAFIDVSSGKIQVSVTVEEQRLVMLYSDNGIGVNQTQLDQLFEPFYTTQADQGGTGLGTHIIKNLVVDTLNGSINAYCQPGDGLSYHISLPDMRYS
ncbi:sensor histidine kinase [Colwellia piezophila]|uniref:sensor histidine kinase n=1 Tax=Colwellia piezophila TaxID=211668 RepID=UPI000367ED91|nr:ATP-binding protein [Colwellia piezophila]